MDEGFVPGAIGATPAPGVFGTPQMKGPGGPLGLGGGGPIDIGWLLMQGPGLDGPPGFATAGAGAEAV
jgi:hypothetical protein